MRAWVLAEFSKPVAPGSSCTISVKFTPVGTGTRTASITLSDNALNSPQIITLSGTGASATGPTTTVSLSTSTLSFPSTIVGTTSNVQYITVSNTGNAPFVLTDISLTGTDFASAGLGTCGISIPVAPGSSCTVSVKFTPVGTGTRTASITLSDNALNSPQIVTLSGTGASATGPTAVLPALPDATVDTQMNLTINGSIAVPAYVQNINNRGKFIRMSYAWFAADGPVNVIFQAYGTDWTLTNPRLATAGRDIAVTNKGSTLSFTLPGPGLYYLKPHFTPTAPTSTLLIWVESTASIASSAGSATNATSVGIVPNSASIQDTAINAAIKALPNGGSLYFPAGQYLVSALTISRSNVGLILAPGACIEGNGSAQVVQVNGGSNVSISGQGCLDSGGASYLMLVKGATNVNVSGVLLRDNSSWGVPIEGSDYVTFDDVKVFSNVDGMDPVTSTHVTLENGFIGSEDDGVSVKNKTGFSGHTVTDTVQILNMSVISTKSALKIGTETVGPLNNITFDHIDVIDGERGMVVAGVDGGPLSNITYSNIRLFMTNWPTENRSGRVIEMVEYENADGRVPTPTPMTGIYFSNIYANQILDSLFDTAQKYPAVANITNMTINVGNLKSGQTIQPLFKLDPTYPYVSINPKNINIGWNGLQAQWSGVGTGTWFPAAGVTQFGGALPVSQF